MAVAGEVEEDRALAAFRVRSGRGLTIPWMACDDSGAGMILGARELDGEAKTSVWP